MCRSDRVCTVFVVAVVWAFCTLFTASAPVTIVHMTGIHGQPFYDFLVDRAAAFERQYPDVHMEIQNHPSGYADKLLAMLGTGMQVDVIDSTPTLLLKNDKDYFADLNPYLKADNVDLYRLIPAMMSRRVLESEGRLLALPNQLYSSVVGYNRSVFDELGVAPLGSLGDEWNWEWIRRNAARLTIDVDGDGQPETVGIGFSRNLERVAAAVHQAGGAFFEKDLNPRQALFDTAEVRQGLAFYVEIVERGWARIGGTLNNRAVAIDLATFGTTATFLRQTEDVWEAVVQPKGPVRRGGPFWLGPMRVMKESENPEWGCRWLCFLTLDQESQVQMMRMTGRLPLHMPTLSRLDTYLNYETATVRDYLRQLADASIDDDNFPTVVSPVKNDMVRVFDQSWAQVLNGSLALESFTGEIQRRIQAILDELHATP
ncbi:MAG: ABC transporter substrate-binding protein [Limnochordia bacterium]|jgi:ABC-type glycerol-3-phosphate transport system substrate-binding protein